MYLVVGANGQLGNCIRLFLKDTAIYTDKEELDITDENAVKEFVKNNNFKCIINCSAYTAVDKAENDVELATKINVAGVRNLAKTNIPLIHISTDYVFNGKNNVPYVETDTTDPMSVYGKTKLEGEKEVLKYSKSAIIIRTAWLYSQFGNNFLKTMLRLGKEKESLNVVFDQVGTPTYAIDLAEVIFKILQSGKYENTKEIYHFSNEGVCSWYDFAVEIMKEANLTCRVKPIESKDYPTLAVRPSFSVLNKGKIKKDFDVEIRHWRKAMIECLNILK
ncbi:MAG: dTDP-4-dehydrorhamnose reductase [Rickettsiales bacterium]|nr:dTDP-4-dehydrorhamnose reductase [Rickettsiales bacterium]